MKKSRNKTRAHFILFAEDTPFRSRKEVDRKKRGKRGYQKHKVRYVLTEICMRLLLIIIFLLGGCTHSLPRDSACMMWINEICHCRNNPSLTIWWPNGPVSEEARLKACGII